MSELFICRRCSFLHSHHDTSVCDDNDVGKCSERDSDTGVHDDNDVGKCSRRDSDTGVHDDNDVGKCSGRDSECCWSIKLHAS